MKFTKCNLAATATMLLCSSMLFCGCVKNNDVVIKVNDKEITRAEYFEDFDKLKNMQLKNAPKELKKENGYIVLSLKEKYSNDIVLRTLLNEEFDKRNIKATEEEIAKKQKSIIEQLGSEEQFKNILKENNISNKKLHDDLAQEVKMDKLVEALNVKPVSDSDIQKFYDNNKEKFNLPERAMVSHILFETNVESIKRKISENDKDGKLSSEEIDKKAKEEATKKEALAKEVLEKLKTNPKDFAKLAKEYSDDPVSAQKGGDLGYITRDAVVKEFGDVAFTQKIGVISPLVKSQFGHHIIVVNDKSKAGLQPLSQVKNDLKAYLDQQKKLEAVQNHINGLKDKATIEFLDKDLDPSNIKKQLQEAIKKQLEQQKQSESASGKTDKDSKQ